MSSSSWPPTLPRGGFSRSSPELPGAKERAPETLREQQHIALGKMPQASITGCVDVACCGPNCSGVGLDLLCPGHLTCFEDRSQQMWPSVLHFALAKRFIEGSLAEELRMARTLSDLLERYGMHEDHLAIDWEDHQARHLRNGFISMAAFHKEAKRVLLKTAGARISYKGVGDVLVKMAESIATVLMEVRDLLLKDSSGCSEKMLVIAEVETKKKKRRGRKGRSPFYHKDGTATFDMVSSSSVRVTIEAEEMIIPMSAIPARAKTAAHIYQFKKKRGFDGSDAERDDNDSSDEDIDSEAEEYLVQPSMFEAGPDDACYSCESSVLMGMGFDNQGSNLAALIHTGGDLQLAVNLLIEGQT